MTPMLSFILCYLCMIIIYVYTVSFIISFSIVPIFISVCHNYNFSAFHPNNISKYIVNFVYNHLILYAVFNIGGFNNNKPTTGFSQPTPATTGFGNTRSIFSSSGAPTTTSNISPFSSTATAGSSTMFSNNNTNQGGSSMSPFASSLTSGGGTGSIFRSNSMPVTKSPFSTNNNTSTNNNASNPFASTASTSVFSTSIGSSPFAISSGTNSHFVAAASEPRQLLQPAPNNTNRNTIAPSSSRGLSSTFYDTAPRGNRVVNNAPSVIPRDNSETSNKDDQAPAHFICPISEGVMEEPVTGR